jgi:hypothetical protein
MLHSVGPGVPAAVAKKSSPPHHMTSAVPHLCKWGESSGALTAAEVTGSCHEHHARSQLRHTPYGTVGVAVYTAEWGTRVPGLVPQHTLSVGAFRETGSGKAAEYIEKQARLQVIGEGTPVGPGGKVTASWSGDTYSCQNPPTGDCTNSEFQAAKGRWVVTATVGGAPPGTPGGEENLAEQNEDDARDLQQEEALKDPVVSVGLYIAARL